MVPTAKTTGGRSRKSNRAASSSSSLSASTTSWPVAKKGDGPLRDSLALFGDRTSIHGVGFVFGRDIDLGRFERFLWLVVTSILSCVAAYLTYRLVCQSNENPTLTVVETTARPISEVPFPTVALCASGIIDFESKLEAYGVMGYSNRSGDPAKLSAAIAALKEHIPGWPDDMTLSEMMVHMIGNFDSAAYDEIAYNYGGGATVLEAMLNSSREAEALRAVAVDIMRKKYADAGDRLNVDPGNYAKILDMLFSTTRQCGEFIERCWWNGRSADCSTLFELTPTDLGFCCAFNLQHGLLPDHLPMAKFFAEKRRHGGPAVVNQENAELMGMDLTPASGSFMGLSVILDAHSDRVHPRTLLQNFEGFTAAVMPRSDGVSVVSNGFLVPSGRVTRVAIRATAVEAEDGLREALSPEQRKCYFHDEHTLHTFKSYSTSRCRIQCACDDSYRTVGCVPWNVPRNDTNVCNPSKQAEFFAHYYELGFRSSSCSECLPDCSGFAYDHRVTSARFRRCDGLNMGSSNLCSLGAKGYYGEAFRPQMWADLAAAELGADRAGEFARLESPTRRYPADVTFPSALAGAEYDAFDKDVALVQFFFDRDTIPSFRTSVRVTPAVFLSELGGIFGLCLGCSLISFLEVAYWLGFKLACRIVGVSDNRKKNYIQSS